MPCRLTVPGDGSNSTLIFRPPSTFQDSFIVVNLFSLILIIYFGKASASFTLNSLIIVGIILRLTFICSVFFDSN